MTPKIEYLKNHLKLPGKRANLELLYKFSREASDQEIQECLTYKDRDINNTPEEFILMCGVLATCMNQEWPVKETLELVSEYANSDSWRVRETVAMGIQELVTKDAKAVIDILDQWVTKNEKYKRCIIAGLCEPKNLKDTYLLDKTFTYLSNFTQVFIDGPSKLTEDQKILRKALAYGWSVAMVEDIEKGKKLFEAFVDEDNKHIKWILKINLKKNRLIKKDKDWVEKTLIKIG